MKKSNIYRIFYQNTCGDCIYNSVKNLDLNSASMERSMQNRAHFKDYVLFPLPFPWIVLDSPQYWNQILVNVKMKKLLSNNKKLTKFFQEYGFSSNEKILKKCGNFVINWKRLLLTIFSKNGVSVILFFEY